MYDTDGTFHRRINDYVSISYPGSPSPAYTVANAARRLIDAGRSVDLPEGYSVDTLDTITWTLGYYDVERRVSERQADELKAIAQTLISSHNPELEPDERVAVVRVLKAS